MTDSLLDMQLVRELREVMGEGFQAVCVKYSTDGEKRLFAMKKAIAEKDAGMLRSQAHSLKGASANLGATTVASLCFGLEEMAQAENWPDATAQLEKLSQEFYQTLDALLQ